jgi:xylulokinase
MGTSDVVLVSTAAYNPHEEYHAFFHPAQIAPPSSQDVDARQEHEDMRYFNMLVYKSEYPAYAKLTG